MPISYFPNNGLPDYYSDIGYWQSYLARSASVVPTDIRVIAGRSILRNIGADA
jgi:hypothetical protein